MSTPYEENNKIYDYANAINKTYLVAENMILELNNKKIASVIQPQLSAVQLLCVSLPSSNDEADIFCNIREYLNSINSFLCVLVYQIKYLNQSPTDTCCSNTTPPLPGVTLQEVDDLLHCIQVMLYIMVQSLVDYYIAFALDNGIVFTNEQALYILSDIQYPEEVKTKAEGWTIQDLCPFIQADDAGKCDFCNQFK